MRFQSMLPLGIRAGRSTNLQLSWYIVSLSGHDVSNIFRILPLRFHSCWMPSNSNSYWQARAIASSVFVFIPLHSFLASSKNILSILHFLPKVFAYSLECYYNPQDVDLRHVVGVEAPLYPVTMLDSRLQMDFALTSPIAFASLDWLSTTEEHLSLQLSLVLQPHPSLLA